MYGWNILHNIILTDALKFQEYKDIFEWYEIRIAYIAMFTALAVMNSRGMVLRLMTPCSSPNGYKRSSETESTAFKKSTHFDPNGGVCIHR